MDEGSKSARDVGALCEYAAKAYPTRGLWSMLNDGGKSDRFTKAAAHREFCISYLPGTNKINFADADGKSEEKLQRHISFDDEGALRAFMRRRRPVRLDVGGVCTIRPKYERFFPTGCQDIARRDFTVDVDIDEYDKTAPSRTCCTGRDSCESCWPLVTIGCMILDRGLRDLGARDKKFCNLGPRWFFSGGRGMHCWVTGKSSSPEFYALSSSPDKSMRETLAERLAPASPNSVLWRAVHACDPTAVWIVQALVLPCDLQTYGKTQKFCGGESDRGLFLGWYAARHPASAVYALRLCVARTNAEAQAESVRRDVHEAIAELLCWSDELASVSLRVRAAAAGMRRLRAAAATRNCNLQNLLSSTRDERFEADAAIALDRMFGKLFALATSDESGVNRMLRRRDPMGMARAIAEAALMCLMPRVDRPVTEEANHLLKAPLSVHPMSMRLAVEVPTDGLLDFFPRQSPTLSMPKEQRAELRWTCERDGEKIAADALRKFDHV